MYSGLNLTERMVDKIWRKSWHFFENRRSFRSKPSPRRVSEHKSV